MYFRIGLGRLRGLSPLARGNHPSACSFLLSDGPIPARAGEPRRAVFSRKCCRAYPRSRGGTTRSITCSSYSRGLSPLARGNLGQHLDELFPVGPIPARAGEPGAAVRAGRGRGAYPRSRGGTQSIGLLSGAVPGLSPLARGNPQPPRRGKWLPGPIPARAGEPCRRRAKRRNARAYPRSRGGTYVSSGGLIAEVGLSPLARGNRPTCGPRRRRSGPIPARAGEPMKSKALIESDRAYPRSRGGTPSAFVVRFGSRGLSPLARGNLDSRAEQASDHGPIPARAGEPQAADFARPHAGAYPRSRGGTMRPGSLLAIVRGLSPLARGNRPC